MKNVLSSLPRVPGLIRCMSLSVLFLAAGAHAQENAALSAKVIAWSNQNIGAFKQAYNFAHGKQHPAVPVPPQVDPPCHLCGDTTQTQGEAQVAAWVKQAQEPEVTYMQTLLSDGRQVALLGGANSDLLSPAAQKALRQFDDDNQAISDAGAIASELVNQKAGPMAQQYGKDPKRAYAGTMFLLSAGKTLALLGGDNGAQNQLMQDAETWEQSISDKIQSDVLSGHKYNLCPVYGEIVRSVILLGGQEPQNMEQYAQMLQKLQDLVKFNVNLDLKVMIDGTDGSHMHADWKGKAKLKLNLDLANSCYTPVFDSGGKLAVTVANWDMIAKAKRSDGSTETIPVQLTSDHSYNAPLGTPQLNLCDPQPLFQMPTPTSYPPEEITAKGHRSKTVLFGSFLSAVVATNEVNSGATNAVTGGAPTLPGGGPSPSGSGSSGSGSSGSGSSGMDADKQALDAHKGDINWLMSPAGQAVIADMQKQALQTTQSKMAAAGVVVPNATSFAQLGQSMSSAHLLWTNGEPEPVNKTLHVKKDTADITLTVTVQQAQ
ncbi:MAG TPA: hypothetical protein VG225_00040 [Terracidiphilus sp.]|nr:hypothetical protein [Terracidiphilus sp.]